MIDGFESNVGVTGRLSGDVGYPESSIVIGAALGTGVCSPKHRRDRIRT